MLRVLIDQNGEHTEVAVSLPIPGAEFDWAQVDFKGLDHGTVARVQALLQDPSAALHRVRPRFGRLICSETAVQLSSGAALAPVLQ